MGFDEFLSRRLPELLRFAIVLCQSVDDAQRVVVDVLVRAFSHWSAVVEAGREFVLLRTAVVRYYLATSEDPAGSPRDDTGRSPTPELPAAAAATGLAAALAGVPALERATLALADYSSQTIPEIAAALRRDEPDVTAALENARVALHAVPALAGYRSIADAVEHYAQSFQVDHEVAAGSVLDRLESEPFQEPDPAVFESMFALAGLRRAELPHPSRQGAPSAERVGESSPADVVPHGEPGRGKPGTGPTSRAGPRRISTRRTGGMTWRVGAALALVVAAALVSGLASIPGSGADGSTRRTGAPTQVARPAAAGEAGDVSPSVAAPGVEAQPGVTVLRQDAGVGAQTVAGIRTNLELGRALAIEVMCSGPGPASVGPVVVEHCEGAEVGENVTAEQVTSLAVRAGPSTTWRFVVLDEPVRRTNGLTRYPVDPALASGSPGSRVGQADGVGPGVVVLVSGSTTSRVENLRVILACTGDGVTLSSTHHAFDGLYTRSCDAGYSYEFDVASAIVPETVTVDASSATMWRLAVIRS